MLTFYQVLSTPARLFFSLGMERRTCLRPAHRHETEAVQFLKRRNNSLRELFLLFTSVLPAGNLSLHERYRLSIFLFINSRNIWQPFWFLPKDTCVSFSESTKKSGRSRSFLCSRQESNLQLRFRKPMFYPLNYGSKREKDTTNL